MNVLIVLGSLVPILLLGNLATRFFARSEIAFVERMPLALAFGSGVVALLLFYFSLIYVPLALTLTIAVSLIVVSAAYGIRIVHGWRFSLRGYRFSILVLAPVLALSAAVTVVALHIDLGFDGWSNWGFKAYVAFIKGGWTPSFFAQSWPQFIHHDYPLLMASVEAWAFAFLRQTDESSLKIIFPFFYLGLLLLFYAATREILSRRIGLLFTVLLGTTPYFSSIAAPSGYADVPLMLYVFGAVLFIRRWLQFGREFDLLIGAILAALSVWVKREGIVYWGVNFVAVAIWLALARTLSGRERVRSLLIFLLPAVVMIAPWFAFLATFHIPPSDFQFVLDFSRWVRLPTIALNMIGQYLALSMWGGLWIIFFVLSLARLRVSTFADRYVWACAVVPFVLLQLSFLFSIWEPFTEHMLLASDRLCMHEIAIAWYWIALQSGGLEQWLNQKIGTRAIALHEKS
jgi:hypothetical protein